MNTRTELIARLRLPILPAQPTFGDFILIYRKLELIAEALAVLLDEQRPK